MSELWKSRNAVYENALIAIFVIFLIVGAVGGIFLLRTQMLSVNPYTKQPEPIPPSSYLAIKLVPSTITEDLTAIISGTLTGTKENKTIGLVGKTISFYNNQSGEASLTSLGEAVTDSSGNFNYSWSGASSLSPNSYQIKATWEGDSEYPKASAIASARATEMEIMTLLDKVKERGVAMMLVTHNPRLVSAKSRHFRMRNGVLTEQPYTSYVDTRADPL